MRSKHPCIEVLETRIAPAAGVFSLGGTDGRSGFTIVGAAPGDYAVGSVSSAHDVYGDGFDALSVSVPGIGIGTISNEDAPPVVTISGGVMLEGDDGNGTLFFTITLDAPSGLPATVQYATSDGSAMAGEDYTSMQGLLTFAPGETEKTVSIPLMGDTVAEDHEYFLLKLSAPTGTTIGNATAIGTILNDDAILSIEGGSVREGDAGTTPLTFVITMEKPSAIPVTVSYVTVQGTASAGSDYATHELTELTFAPGETSKIVTLLVMADLEVEAHETLSVALSNPVGATLGMETATGTILNDDTRILIDDGAVLEGKDGTRTITFTVSLTMESMLPVSVDLESVNGTATAGVDYVAILPTTLDFAPGETSQTISVEILGDIEFEQSEDFSLVLRAAVNAVIEDGTGIGTILNDDVKLLGKRKATYIDEDGDIVTIKVNKGTLKVEDFTLVPAGEGARLALVDFSGDKEFSRTNLSITAQRAAGTEKGPRSVDVGHINASGVDLGNVVIKGDLGRIDSGNSLDPQPGLLSLKANSLGARGSETQLPGGSLLSRIDGMLKNVKIGGSVTGADLSVSGDVKAVKIAGDLLGATIQSDGRIGLIQVSGDLAGTEAQEARISAQGLLAPASASKAVAIGRVQVGGSVDHAEILAGNDRTGTATNANAGIGSIKVGLDWSASDVAAGVAVGIDGVFGTEDDERIAGGNSIVARIASIQIKGTAPVTGDAGSSHYGFVAEEIAAFKLAGDKVKLSRGPSNDLAGVLVGAATNLMIREVS